MSGIFTLLISCVLGTNFPLYQAATGIGKNFPLKKYRDTPSVKLYGRRRLSEGLSDDCFDDIVEYGVWCLLDPSYECSGLQPEYTKWVIQIDHDTEHMCYPSVCTARDLEYLFSAEMSHLNNSAKYCSFECPPIKFDISGYSEEGQMMNISGLYNYADLSYECAGAAAVTEISRCEETGACPDDVNGLTTCTLHYEDRLTYAHIDKTWKGKGKACLPDECTNEWNLERMEDFLYAYLRFYEEYQNGLYLTSDEIREGYSVDYVCPIDSMDNPIDPMDNPIDPMDKEESKSNLSKYVTIFGIVTALLFTICLGAFCVLRLYRGFSSTPIVTIEFHNRGTFARLGSILENEEPMLENKDPSVGEESVEQRNVRPVSARPVEGNETGCGGEREHPY